MNEVATMPLAMLTAAVGLYQMLKLLLPPAAKLETLILVWAGSSISFSLYRSDE
jgi:NADPH:quinone reductase-like Zn-dependent oxidoreductase